jgi:opacity protein-like surface antigen
MGIVILILTAAGLAQAQSNAPGMREGRWQFALQTRYTSSKDFSGEGGSKLSISDDLGWGFGFGYNVSDQFNLGFSFTWRSIPYVATIVDADDSQNSTRYSNWLDTSTLGVNGEWTILRSRISPYVFGAVGWIAIDTNIYAGSDYGCWWDPWWGYICSEYGTSYGTNATSWSLGTGLRMELTRDVFLRVGYEHGWVNVNSFDGSDMFRVDIGMLH